MPTQRKFGENETKSEFREKKVIQDTNIVSLRHTDRSCYKALCVRLALFDCYVATDLSCTHSFRIYVNTMLLLEFVVLTGFVQCDRTVTVTLNETSHVCLCY